MLYTVCSRCVNTAYIRRVRYSTHFTHHTQVNVDKGHFATLQPSATSPLGRPEHTLCVSCGFGDAANSARGSIIIIIIVTIIEEEESIIITSSRHHDITTSPHHHTITPSHHHTITTPLNFVPTS